MSSNRSEPHSWRYSCVVRDEIISLTELRNRLEHSFRPDTASQGFLGTTPSTGHCAAVAAIVYELFGGEMISAPVEGQSHWINRLQVNGRTVDADLTGDQFGRLPIQIGPPGELYAGLRVRSPAELTSETLARASLLAKRAGLNEIARTLEEKRATRSGLSHERA